MKYYLTIILSVFFVSLFAQNNITIKVINDINKQPIYGATISIKNKSIAVTDSNGIATISISGKIIFSVSAIGYETKNIIEAASSKNEWLITMNEEQKILEEITIVTSTRTNQNIEYAPIKIEVLDAEEMQEESTVKPSTVMGIIGDISGVQIQQTSAVSGNSNVRIQGLDGRYTQILRDGLPLYEGFSGGFGIMSIPPLDLKQAELIKGSASTLYGAGAIGGLVNLISKKPTNQQEGIITINQTTLKETNLNSFFSKRLQKFGYTLYAGATRQKAVDVNKDGFSDVSNNQSVVLHPRLFFYPNKNSTITIGYTKTLEKRKGGDMFILENNQTDSVHRFYEENKLDRNSAEILYDLNVSNNIKVQYKSSLSSFDRSIANADGTFKANQLDYFNELSVLINQPKYTWISGLNFSGNRFRKLQDNQALINNNSNNTAGLFSQFTYKWNQKSSIEMGLRNDYQFKYGNFILPRIALYHQINQHWGTRLGFGVGYKIPNALTPQFIDYAIEKIKPIDASVKVENSYGYNAEVNYKINFGDDHSLFINQAFFLTTLQHPMIVNEQADGIVYFSTASKPIISKGFDTYLKLKMFDWEFYAGYTYTIAERKYLAQNQFMPLTPKNRMAIMLTKEWEGKLRFCIESSYNGSQYKLDNTKTPSFLFLASMIDYKLNKHCNVILNVENILDYRQSRTESLYSGSITNPVFKTLWAPIDGRAINLCMRINLN